MKKEWADMKNAEQEVKREEAFREIRAALESENLFTEEELNLAMQEAEESARLGLTFLIPLDVNLRMAKLYAEDKIGLSEFELKLIQLQRKITRQVEKLHPLYYSYDRYVDSAPVEFDGDIIITDPCYIIRENTDDWRRCGYGEDMGALGIRHFMTRDTIYGDWSCSVYNTDTCKKIGNFCADAGLVSVFLLDEVLKYNPGFDYHTERKWTTALLKNFKGTVQFVVDQTEYDYDGKRCTDYEVRVVGHGINKRTGKALNFVGKQTGF